MLKSIKYDDVNKVNTEGTLGEKGNSRVFFVRRNTPVLSSKKKTRTSETDGKREIAIIDEVCVPDSQRS